MKIGYARASSIDQSTEIQEQQLKDAGCDLVLSENASGRRREGRQRLDDALQMLKAAPDSKLVVCRLDRLGRNLRESLQILDELKEAKADLIVLDMNIDTGTPHGRFFGQMLLAMAEWETELRRERQALGIAKAKKAGKYKGRAPTKHAAEIKRLAAEGMAKAAIARELGVGRQTVYRVLERG